MSSPLVKLVVVKKRRVAKMVRGCHPFLVQSKRILLRDEALE